MAAERLAPEILSVGRSNVITVLIENRSAGTLRGTVMDDPIDHATTTGLPARIEIAPYETAHVRYEITPSARGERRLRAVTVRYALPLGMLWAEERIEIPKSVAVYPDVHAARVLELLRRRGRQDARLGSLRVHGGDTELERLRPYQRGDEIRHIDWRASARREDLVTRQYQAESDQSIVFAIDVGRAMRGGSQRLTSMDRALSAALLTADVALRGGDRAGLLTFDDRPRSFLRPTGGRSGGRKLTRAAYAIDAGLSATDFRAAVVFLKRQVKARSLFILFTNVLDPRGAKELSNAVKSLVPSHLPLCVLMRDDDVTDLALGSRSSPGDVAVDPLVMAAAAEAVLDRDHLIRALRSAGSLVLDARPEDVTPELVKRYLEIKSRRLL